MLGFRKYGHGLQTVHSRLRRLLISSLMRDRSSIDRRIVSDRPFPTMLTRPDRCAPDGPPYTRPDQTWDIAGCLYPSTNSIFLLRGHACRPAWRLPFAECTSGGRVTHPVSITCRWRGPVIRRQARASRRGQRDVLKASSSRVYFRRCRRKSK